MDDCEYEMASQNSDKSQKDKRDFDPFTERKVPNPTTNGETLIHILKASLGTGILAMPCAFKGTGLIGGIFATLLTGFICTHCAYILVKCAHVLYHKTRRSEMTYPEVAEAAFANGPKWARTYSTFMRYMIQISLLITYFGACTAYALLIAENLKPLIIKLTTENSNKSSEEGLPGDPKIRIILLCLTLPLILMSWIPNLKYLAPVSMIANIFMGIGLAISSYILVGKLNWTSAQQRPYWPDLSELPGSISIIVFAVEAIGMIMPLENNMKTPKKFVGICGVLNIGMACVTVVYIILGFLGYAAYGSETDATITMNLSEKGKKISWLSIAVNVLIALAVYCTFTLVLFVCLEIIWNNIKDYFQKKPLVANYCVRTALVLGAVGLAIAVPAIEPVIGLIGAFCFSILGLLLPVIIETVTLWDKGFGKCNWIVMKNIMVSLFGILVLIFGSAKALSQIFT